MQRELTQTQSPNGVSTFPAPNRSRLYQAHSSLIPCLIGLNWVEVRLTGEAPTSMTNSREEITVVLFPYMGSRCGVPRFSITITTNASHLRRAARACRNASGPVKQRPRWCPHRSIWPMKTLPINQMNCTVNALAYSTCRSTSRGAALLGFFPTGAVDA